MKNSFLIIVSALIVLGIFFAGCTNTSSSTATPVRTLSTIPTVASHTVTTSTTYQPNVVTSSAVDDFTVLEDHVETGDYGAKYIVGTLKSNRDVTYSYVQVTINLYDSSNTQVGSTLANVNNLEPFAAWKFKAPIMNSDATTYKIMGVNAF